MMLPDRLFFTGVPGSRWSGIAQTLESVPGFNITNRDNSPEFTHHGFSGHKGTYFGRSQDWEAKLDNDYIDSAWASNQGCRLVKSHDWPYMLDQVYDHCQQHGDWLMLVYRPDMSAFAWWYEVGGFAITHPKYDHYKDHVGMMAGISRENQCMLEFGHRHDVTWNHFSVDWVQRQFGHRPETVKTWPDILVALLK